MAHLTDFSTLTFDCYGTLIDWERGILNELEPWIASRGRLIDGETILQVFGETEARCEAEAPQALYPAVLAEVFRRLAARWSIELGSGEAERFGGSVGRWPAFPDSAAALQYLKQHYRLVIISNIDRVSFAASNDKLGVTFDRIITAQDVGSYKPDLKNFEYALGDVGRHLGARKAEILHTAQSIYHDIVPAKSIGLSTMWVNRRKALGGGWGATPAPSTTGEATRPDFEVGSLAELVMLHRQQAGKVTQPD